MNIIEKIKNTKNMGSLIRMLKTDDISTKVILDRTSYLNDNVTINERIFNIKNDFFKTQYCSICNINELEWNYKYKK